MRELNVRVVECVLLALCCWSATGWAQSAPQNVEVEPVTCWWRTGATAVRVGESLSLLLTCSILESEAVRAVVDRSRLGPAAVQFPPYEVTGGTQSNDHLTPGRRFIQYDYALRLIGEDAFGRDVPIPELSVTYRIESRVQQDAAVQGREQTYVLPALPMRVTSLVADGATHIRESGVPTLAEIAARELRARMFRLVALILLGIAGLTLAIGLVRWARQGRTRSLDAHRQLIPRRAVLQAVRQELRAVQSETRGGWTPDAVARALSATRLVASYAMRHAVPQRALERDAAIGAIGELALGGGFLGRRRVAVSGAMTRQTLRSDGGQVSEAAAIDLDAALGQLTVARYGRATDVADGALDDALAAALRASDRVVAQHTWLAETVASARQSIRGWRPQDWVR